jgi:REP element-mobilizing transposase RayT
MGRGIEKAKIFRSDIDRCDFLDRLAKLCYKGNLIVYAWALLPSHFHLLLRTGRESLFRSMKQLLTG